VTERVGEAGSRAGPVVGGLTVGVDIGGTKVAAGVVDTGGTILAINRRDTPSDDPQKTEDLIADLVHELQEAYRVEAVGVGAAGFVDADRSTVRFAPNLAWRNEPLGWALERRLQLPVVVENDANAAAWAEARFGVGHGEPHVVVITVGTGIGGGVIIDHRLLRGSFGIAAEMGHLTVVPDGRLCGCGNRGCWEQYASGRALVSEARTLAASSPALAEQMLALVSGDAAAIDGPTVTAAARQGDAAALRAFESVGNWLGRGMAEMAAVLDPGLFVVAGGVSAAGEILLEPAQRAFTDRLVAREFRPAAQVRVARLGGDEAGIIGAADLVRHS
jgi:glucokinase